MSTHSAAAQPKITVPALKTRKRADGAPAIVCLTAYSKPMAQLLDPYVDLILVGDSVGMVLYGFETTLPVTLDMMIAHGAAVKRGTQRALVVVDMPFATYQKSPEEAFTNAARIMIETGCSAVKIEGGTEMAETVRFLSQRGIPVLAHIGLMPQSLATSGGYRAHGKTTQESATLLESARTLEKAGAFAIVLEGMIEPLAAQITRELSIPTIGIGASPTCDGQILVTDDMIGLFQDFTPKFVEKFANVGAQISEAAANYAKAIHEGAFPEDKHCFGVEKTKTLDTSKEPISQKA
ncbi:MAG: 3-methyl-2-oxobutanoate hydroxymethyltransferase [Pseudobdellovibrionaceae bacterium]